MIRNLLATTAIATLVATGAYAEDTTKTAPEAAPVTQEATQPAAEPVAQDANQAAAPMAQADGHLASNIIGETVYNGTGDNAENIGDVNDIVISADGKIEAVIIGVGGFLGLGEKNVAVEYSKLDWVERDGDRWLVAPMTKDQLSEQTAFDTSVYAPAPAKVAVTDPAAPAVDTTTAAQDTTVAPAPDATAPATTDTMAAAPADPAPDATVPATTDTMAAAPADPATDATAADAGKTAAIDRSTLTEIPSGDIRAEEMIGTTVYGAKDENVGEIGDVILTSDGKVDSYIIDVGGFLGMGEKEVAVGSDNLAFMTDKDGNKYLYTTFTKEQLEASQTYDAATYAEKRDDQRVIMTK